MDVGIDLGTATVIVYIGGQGVVLSEPSVIAVNLKTDSVISVGQEAYDMVGKTPSHIQAIRPLSKGVVCDYKMTEEMVKFFIKKVCRDSLVKPRIALCVPSGITNVESNAVIDVAIASGARKVYLIEEPVAAAIGANIDIEKPNGNMIVDIGGGTTDIAVLSLNGIVNKKSIKVAGDAINDSIIKYIRSSHGVLIGERMADQIKRTVASVCWEDGEDISAPVKGRNLTTGLPCSLEISRSMLYDCVMKEVDQIVTAVKEVIEKTPPELVGDIYTNGITLTGGGSLLHGMDRLLEKQTKIHTALAEDPVNCVAIGTGKSFQYLDKLVDGFVIPSMQRF
ncbi:MAG TPA: rod shape-determining protein [Candidatus Negativibacillus faecipullorum]|nr:rod shape-determining protein [Candidatus Negativibacillus faecipullorum]